MREHIGLYRGKRLDNGEWVEGYLLRSKIKERIRYEIYVPFTEEEEKENEGHFLSAVGGIWHKVDPDIIGECTGLKANGKLIFEGDILFIKTIRESVAKETRNDEYTAYGVVVFNKGHFELEGKGLVLCTYWGLKSLYTAASFEEYEIVGNIYDNPELLKGGEG